MSSEFALEINSLEKRYDQLVAVDDVSFSVKSGEIFGLLGPNGSGKTSIISCIVTLENPSKGNIKVYGKDVQEYSRFTKSLIGFVPQEIINHGYFNVVEILQFYTGFFGQKFDQNYCDYLLDKLALFDHRHKKVKALSGGMKRRLLIAKALIHKPKLLLLDEPTAGVDIELRNALWDFVNELRDSGLSILLTTHYLEEAEMLCDRVGFLQAGKIKRLGDTKDLIKDLTFRTVKIELKDVSKFKTSRYVVDQKDNLLFLRMPSEKSIGMLLEELEIATSNIEDIRIHEGSLEEAFLQVLGGK